MSYAKPVRPARRRRPRSPRRLAAWALAALGLALFLVGNIGALTGLITLPFDQHHVLTQLGGGAVAIVGLGVATKR